MRAINLYTYTQVQAKNCTEYENILSSRSERHFVKSHEYENLVSFVQLLTENGVTMEELDGFYFSYTLEQIGKEFDLLKIEKNKMVLNVELKSQEVSREKIRKQLMRNKYYLEYLEAELYFFTYVQGETLLYTLGRDDRLERCGIEKLLSCLKQFKSYERGEIRALFRPKDFLISPLHTPEKFLNHHYFLTQQQEQIQNEILDSVEKKEWQVRWGISGKAGTGKTLLLYDIARECSRFGKCCMIHSGGMLCEGHRVLNRVLDNVTIIAEKDVKEAELDDYPFLFLDETQRIDTEVLKKVLEIARRGKRHIIFSYDDFQILSYREEKRNIVEKLRRLHGFRERMLSGKIRANKEMASFIRSLMNRRDRQKTKYLYQNIDVLYAKDSLSADKMIQFYTKQKSYVFFNYTQYRYEASKIDIKKEEWSGDFVIGQEFDNVLVAIGQNFFYDAEGKLQGNLAVSSDYKLHKLLYQGVSRAREKLCVLIVEKESLFSDILSIKSEK